MVSSPIAELTPDEQAAADAARAFMSQGERAESTRIMQCILDQELAQGYAIPLDELRDLWAFTCGYIEARTALEKTK